ncbi:hypothetical protein Ciccas_012238 [Cichlidogyrus casuarinus]|uniref:Protein mab-21-like 2 n=1 Tax=Cichlidogyrus casuarinus TaxID=1844966 RepID=A0ABD2PTY4_9PLAT
MLSSSSFLENYSTNGSQVFPDPEPQIPCYQQAVHAALNEFASTKLEQRRQAISKTLREVIFIAKEILHEVEIREPRFISTLKTADLDNPPEVDIYFAENDGIRYEGVRVVSPSEFEVVLYLNQMGVFNFVDDGTVPGGAVLKLSDGRKRSMSLWVEFITASGYLSARKIRARFHSLVCQAVEVCSYSNILRVLGNTSEVKVRIRERCTLQLTPAFRCGGLWPRSASHWPDKLPLQIWPTPALVADVKREGFNLLSQESVYTKDKQASVEGDAWLLDFHGAEERLLSGGTRRKTLALLKALFDVQFKSDSSLTLMEYHLKTLVLFECEKHGEEKDWTNLTLPDRINGILLQTISCLQHRRCPHYFIPQLDLFRGRTATSMDATARVVWDLMRTLIARPNYIRSFI